MGSIPVETTKVKAEKHGEERRFSAFLMKTINILYFCI